MEDFDISNDRWFEDDLKLLGFSNNLIGWIKAKFPKYNVNLENLFLDNTEFNLNKLKELYLSKKGIELFFEDIDYDNINNPENDFKNQMNYNILKELLTDLDFLIIFNALKNIKNKIIFLKKNLDSFSTKILNIKIVKEGVMSDFIRVITGKPKKIEDKNIGEIEYYEAELRRIRLEIDDFLIIQEKLFSKISEMILEEIEK